MRGLDGAIAGYGQALGVAPANWPDREQVEEALRAVRGQRGWCAGARPLPAGASRALAGAQRVGRNENALSPPSKGAETEPRLPDADPVPQPLHQGGA
mgnify:CR=1 FL=1